MAKETVAAQPKEEPPKNAVVAYDYSQDAGGGFANLDDSHFLVPIIDILQAKSKEVEQETIEGAKAGKLIVRALQLVFDAEAKKGGGLPFIPCGADHVYNEWRPRDKGGGIVKIWRPEDPFVAARKAAAVEAKLKFGKIPTAEGNDLVETFNLYGFGCPKDDEPFMCAVPFTSTKIKLYKGFVTAARAIMSRNKTTNVVTKMPLYAFRRVLRTVFTEKNNETWFNYTNIGMDGKDKAEAVIDPMSDLYDTCRNFSKQIEEGLVKADMRSESAGDHGAEAGATEGPKKGPTGDEDMPF